jgi:hypothetical protein
MSVVYSLYDALVSINVPTEKAKAVLDAMERDMFAQLVTRAEFNAEMKLVRHELTSRFELLSKDVQATKDSMGPQVEAKLAAFENRMTVRMGKMMVSIVGVATALIGAMQYLL